VASAARLLHRALHRLHRTSAAPRRRALLTRGQALPTLLSLTLFLLYATTWVLYLFLEYDGRLPLSPVRCWRVDTALWRVVRDAWRLSLIELGLDLAYRRLMISGGRDAKQTVVEGVTYGAASGARRLDLYLPASHLHDDRAMPAPIIVVVPGGGWMFRKRALYTQLAQRLRQLGYAVVVPDLVSFPCVLAARLLCRCLLHIAQRWQGHGHGRRPPCRA
jgi:hypothetical protein